MSNLTFICSNCQREHPIASRIMVGNDEACEDCVLEYTHICNNCGQRIWDAETVSDGRTTVCRNCYEHHYTRCCQCDAIIRVDSAYYNDDEDPYCEQCWDESDRQSSIHDYSYKPEPIFFGEGPRYFGVELEIDHGGRENYAADRILYTANIMDEHLYIKSDGSLDDGMELVSHPMSLDYHMNQMPWDQILDKARRLGFLSHKADTCGLHVHISRDAFGVTMLEQECAIARLLYFVEKFWTELLRFSRRTESQVNRWAARYGMKLSPFEMMDCAKHSYAGRYMAVNLTNQNTIEIRIFRGTLKLNTFLATLQLVNAICDTAVLSTDEELQAMSWHDFLDRITEPELIQYLKERNLYKNEPVSTEEDD